MTIYLIRHAQSQYNAFGTLVPNVELSEYGKTQASKLKGNPDLIIVSPLRRAIDTLNLSQIECDNILVTHLCKERLDGNIINHFENDQPSIETDSEFEERIKKFKELLDEKSKIYKEIYVITHALFINALTKVGVVGNCHKLLYKL